MFNHEASPAEDRPKCGAADIRRPLAAAQMGQVEAAHQPEVVLVGDGRG